jgi:hypothetical protein
MENAMSKTQKKYQAALEKIQPASLGPKTRKRKEHLKLTDSDVAMCGRRPSKTSKGWEYDRVPGEAKCRRCAERITHFEVMASGGYKDKSKKAA